MINAEKELLYHFKKHSIFFKDIKRAVIFLISDTKPIINFSSENSMIEKEFYSALNFDYEEHKDSKNVLQVLYGLILLNDGAWLERKYEMGCLGGLEWWEFYQSPTENDFQSLLKKIS